ncbi:MAG: helix-turn-helix domain-containing protein, partial [Stackebrandtia sp.]
MEGRRRLVERCRTRPIAHVAAEMGISRACASKWVNRYRRYGELGLADRSSAPRHQLSATDAALLEAVGDLRRTHKWSAARITFELRAEDIEISRHTVSRHLVATGLNRRQFIDPNGESNRQPRTITARRPSHMIHVDVKKVGRIPDGGGWRVHGRGSERAKEADRGKTKSKRGDDVYLHSAIDG